MKRLLRAITVVLALTAVSSGAAPVEPKPRTGLLTNERIIAMLKAKVSEQTILALIRKFPDKLDSGPEALVALKRAGASNKVLLAVRRSALAARPAEAAPAPEAGGDGQAAGAESGGAAPEEEGAAAEEPAPSEGGKLSLGLGYPFIALKYDFVPDYSAEARFISRRGIQAFAGRGYWNFYRAAPWTVYAGGEAGYVRFGPAGSGGELSPFLGGAYSPDRNFSFSADISPTLLFLPGGGNHFGIGEIGWAINLGVFIRLPGPAPKAAAEAEAPAAPDALPAAQRESEDENSSWRLVQAPGKTTYQDYLTAAEEFTERKYYARADQAYAKAMTLTSPGDARRVFLYERRGWLAMKQADPAKARDYYLAAISAARQANSYDETTSKAYGGLAASFEKLDNVPLAVKYYQRALELSVSESARREIEKNLRRLDPEAY